MNFYEHTLIARQDISSSQIKQIQEKYTKNKKYKINIIIVINGKKNLNPFLPKTIGIEVNNPSQAFLEKVKNAAKPVDMRKLKVAVFLNKLFPFSTNNAMQNGQTKFSQDAA